MQAGRGYLRSFRAWQPVLLETKKIPYKTNEV